MSLFVALTLTLRAAPGHHLVVSSRADDTGFIFSSSGKISVQLREVSVESAEEGGRTERSRVLVLFEPHSGAFSWEVFPEDSVPNDSARQLRAFKEKRAGYLLDGTIYIFMVGISPAIYVREFRGQAATMNEAEKKALARAEIANSSPAELYRANSWRIVRLAKLGHDFVAPPMSQTVGHDPIIDDVQRDGKKWIVTIRGSWTEVVTLDEDFNLVSMNSADGKPK
jgi:hypothetical protein